MARQKGVIKLQGTIAGLSFIQSKAYGPHVRAARGTHKEVKVNPVLQGNADHAKMVTPIGSIVLRQLKTVEHGFASGDLWPRMTGRMFKAKSMQVADLFESLRGTELNERYPFAKLFAAIPRFEFSIKKNRLCAEMELLSHARFSKEDKATEYLCELTVLFSDGKISCVKDSMETEWIGFEDDLPVYEMVFDIPKETKYFLLIAGVKGGNERILVERFTARGYFICGSGKVGRFKVSG